MAEAATKTIEVNAPVERFFEVITDFPSYPKMLAHLGMTGIHVDSEKGDRKVVTHEIRKVGVTVSYTLEYRLEKPKRLSWTLIKGQMMSQNVGSWELESLGESKTRVKYSNEIKFGLLVPKTLINLMVAKELPELLDAFRKKAENL